MTPVGPSRDDSGTTRLDRVCAGCGKAFLPTGRQRHCSTSCRKRVFRTRRSTALVAGLTEHAVDQIAAAHRARRAHTVYECPDCATRQLGVQRCADCGLFGRAVGLGGACPGCDEPVTLADLGLGPQPTREATR
jgi:hypothetical protein